MTMQPRNPFGLDLETAMQVGGPQFNLPPESQAPKMGKGQLIMGIIADALAGAAGRQGPFAAQMMRQREQEQEEANWGRRLEREQEIKSRFPDVSPMERDVQAWDRMGPAQRETYKQMKAVTAPDPDVFITLPNGHVYAGPRSGLAAAMMGGGQPPAKPIGKLTPIDGGPTPPASGGFRFP